ncbi:MAG: hypothetical protein KF868_00430 [Acidobacteria bacterium]|nr:hypothetical protein [Acidobacteriota bacterium]MCW5969421.1 hypothetical protein [Blastocatellales bacterium]
MGTSYEFECPACGYTAAVSGDDDAGMICNTTTIVCRTCRKLYDATIILRSFDSPEHQEIPIRCPKSKKHAVERWKHPGPCPKCGAQMNRGEACCDWD